jgi:uncharacterized protein (TIRG00374 family)
MKEKGERRIGKGLWYALGFSGISLYFIFKGLEGIGPATGFASVNWLWVGIGLFVQVIVWFTKALRMYCIAIGMDAPVPLGRFFQIYLATCFMSHVTPFNSGGTPLQIYLLKRQGLSLGKATVLTTVDLGLNTIMFGLLIPLAVLIDLNRTGIRIPSLSELVLKWLPVGVGLSVVLFLATKLLKSWSRFRWSRNLHAFLSRKGWLQRLKDEWHRFKEGWLLLTRRNPLLMVGAGLATVAYWLFYLLLAPIIIWAMGNPVSFWRLIGLQLIFNFAQILVPTPGGSGGSELLLTYLFRGVVGGAGIGLFVLLWRGYTYFSSLIVGGFFFWRLTRTSSRSMPK